MMTEIEFFPAAMVGHFNKIQSNPKLKFWGDDATFKYDKLLYSTHYIQERYRKLKDGESYFDSIGYDGIRMLDSGGFQVRTLGANIDPELCIKTYIREKADIGFILDEPLTETFTQELLDKNYQNVKYFADNKHRLPKNTGIINILHGWNPEKRKKYYETVKEFNNIFDGWAIASPKRLPVIYNIWSFFFLLENDETLKDKRIHFLGLTGNKKMAVIYYLAKLNLVKYISFDSTKYGREGLMYDIRNPSYLGERLSISKNAKGKLKSNKFCPCPVCSNTTIEQMQSDCNYSILHNLFWEIKKFDFFDSFETAEDWKNHILESKEYSEETKLAINFIDFVLKHGLEKAEKVFKHMFKASDYTQQQRLL
jgi:queuine/archaeosine tRNA-ribosyltransferase